MSYLAVNLKTIRKVWGKSQGEFASLFVGVNEDNQKSYERKKPSTPDFIYMNRLVELTGIDQASLMNKQLSPVDIPRVMIGSESDAKVKMVNGNTQEIVHDTKEGVLRMLDKALDANNGHAYANKENALTNKEHAANLTELIKLLGIKLNLNASRQASRPSKAKGAKRRGPSERMKGSLDKQEIHSGGNKPSGVKKTKAKKENI